MVDIFIDVIRHANSASEAIRAAQATTPDSLPAPLMVPVLQHLEATTAALPGLFSELSSALTGSLQDNEMVEANQGRNPVGQVEIANGHLARASELSIELSREILAAQLAIEGQGYKP